jgi:hypothetical protein
LFRPTERPVKVFISVDMEGVAQTSLREQRAAPAEYPGYMKRMFGIESLSSEEQQKIIDADWKQYQDRFSLKAGTMSSDNAAIVSVFGIGGDAANPDLSAEIAEIPDAPTSPPRLPNWW